MSANHNMTLVCFGIAKVQCHKFNLNEYFFSISYMFCLNKNMQTKIKSKKIKNALEMIASVFSRKYGSYRMYLEGDSPHQAVMIVCELKWFSHISNRHNMYILIQSWDVFHTQHAIFFAILDTCAGTMWFGHHKVLHVLMCAH